MPSSHRISAIQYAIDHVCDSVVHFSVTFSVTSTLVGGRDTIQQYARRCCTPTFA
jgi:hypothetical protein